MFRRRSVNPLLEVKALQNLSLRFGEGDRVGIIGHNGAGKSTLLKVLAGIYPPTSGARRVRGQISSLFDIALGFEQDATGWENIRYRGYLQGETPRSIRPKVRAIGEFSELGEFLNMPVRYYSAGMLVRLAFSIATSIEPEILLVDEVLGVGDLAFQVKARQRVREMMDRAQLLVMASHDVQSLAALCTTGVWLDHGRVMQVGPIWDVIGSYTSHTATRQNARRVEEIRFDRCRGLAVGDGAQAASWQLDGLPRGTYDVQATWPPDPRGAYSAPYSVYDGPTLLRTVRVNQSIKPFGATAGGAVFQSLGTYPVHSGRLRVVLSNQATGGYVLADAVRVAEVPAGGPLVLDNVGPHYREEGDNWTHYWGEGGYGNRVSYAMGGDGSHAAAWTAGGLEPDEYEVLATWTPHMNRAAKAPYRLYDGDALLAEVRVNQQLSPAGALWRGAVFQSLGHHRVASGTLRVVLANDADGYVIAGAVQVARRPAWGPVIVRQGEAGYEESGTRRAA
jgi:ABC-type polysaccharide/polyol phosphate transport system ATPase subunit